MMYDTIVIGGGAAGMFAAIHASAPGRSVLLLEPNNRLGKKLMITGKGRCNVTNNCTEQEVLRNIPHNGKFLFSAMHAFPPEATKQFFETNGCPLKTERGNRVFPISDKASSIVECLRKKLTEKGVVIRCDRAAEILTQQGTVCAVRVGREKIDCRSVILATGGVSYPTTGSTGDGYAMAARLGHSITPTEGNLVPLEIFGSICQQMQGLPLRNVALKLLSAKGKVLYKDFGEMLFTHFGVSGPMVLSASCHLKGQGCKLLVDLKPALDENALDNRILRDLDKYQNRAMENVLVDLLPKSMIPVVLQILKIDPQLQANAFTRQSRKELVELLKAFPLEVKAKRPVSEAIITSGGVKVSEIDPKTMESKLIPGLFFAGEIIDCDAYTGGFNLQIAWATGYVAGKSTIDK